MLSPSDLPATMSDQMSTELPRGKTIVDVFADFMRYLLCPIKEALESSEPNEKPRWDSISESIELVLTHPNGWGGPQKTHLRNAAVKADIVQDSPAGRSRVHFITEGEAGLRFCAAYTEAGRNLKVRHIVPAKCRFLTYPQPGEEVLIIDAGGGAVDISTYKVLSTGPLRVEELYESQCESCPSQLQISYLIAFISGLVQGGELVTVRATDMVKGVFIHSIHRPIAQPATREVEAFQPRHPQRPGSIFPEVRRRGKENLLGFE